MNKPRTQTAFSLIISILFCAQNYCLAGTATSSSLTAPAEQFPALDGNSTRKNIQNSQDAASRRMIQNQPVLLSAQKSLEALGRSDTNQNSHIQAYVKFLEKLISSNEIKMTALSEAITNKDFFFKGLFANPKRSSHFIFKKAFQILEEELTQVFRPEELQAYVMPHLEKQMELLRKTEIVKETAEVETKEFFFPRLSFKSEGPQVQWNKTFGTLSNGRDVLVFISSGDQLITTIDIQKGEVISAAPAKIEIESYIKVTQLNGNQDALLYANKNNLFMVDLFTGELIAQFPAESTLSGDIFIEKLKDGRLLVAYLTEKNELHVIELNSKKELYKINLPHEIDKEHEANTLRIITLKNGQDVLIVKESESNDIKIINLKTGLTQYEFRKITEIKEFKLVTLQNGKELLVISGENKTLYVLDLNNRKSLLKFEAPAHLFWGLPTTVLDDGREVVVFRTLNNTLHALDLNTGTEVFKHSFNKKTTLTHKTGQLPSGINSLIVEVDKKFSIINLETGAETHTIDLALKSTPSISQFLLLKNGKLILAATNGDPFEVIFFDVSHNEELFRLRLPEEHREIYGFTQSSATGEPILILHGKQAPFLYIQLYSLLEETQSSSNPR